MRSILIVVSLAFACPSISLAQTIFGLPAESVRQELKNLVPREIDSTAILNVTRVRQGRWALLPGRNARLNHRFGPRLIHGPSRTIIIRSRIYPSKQVTPQSDGPARIRGATGTRVGAGMMACKAPCRS